MTRDEAIEVIKEEDSELLQRLSHDELLKSIENISYSIGDSNDQGFTAVKALRAVVKLASTYKDGNYVNEEFNQGLQTAFQLIIEAIEKELG